MHALYAQVLETAMGLAGVRQALGPQARARMGRKIVEPTLHERATIYLLMAQVGAPGGRGGGGRRSS